RRPKSKPALPGTRRSGRKGTRNGTRPHRRRRQTVRSGRKRQAPAVPSLSPAMKHTLRREGCEAETPALQRSIFFAKKKDGLRVKPGREGADLDANDKRGHGGGENCLS